MLKHQTTISPQNADYKIRHDIFEDFSLPRFQNTFY